MKAYLYNTSAYIAYYIQPIADTFVSVLQFIIIFAN